MVLTLLFELSENTTSECTFLDFILFASASLVARNIAAKRCVDESIYEFQPRFKTTIATYTFCIDKGKFKGLVGTDQLLANEIRILYLQI